MWLHELVQPGIAPGLDWRRLREHPQSSLGTNGLTHTHTPVTFRGSPVSAHPSCSTAATGVQSTKQGDFKEAKSSQTIHSHPNRFFPSPSPPAFFPKSCCFKVVLGNFHSLSPLVIKNCQVLSSKWSAADYQGRRSPYLNCFDQSLFC